MASENDKLNEIASVLKAGRTATPVTIRNFMTWFGVQRRTVSNIEYINDELEKAGLRTIPSYLDIWVETPITFELVASHPVGEPPKSSKAAASTEGEGADPVDLLDNVGSNSSFKIGNIVSDRNNLLSVKPNVSILEATTLMLSRGFSQLPVMTNERDVKGVISWESIGARSAKNKAGDEVRHYMEEHHEISSTASLFVAIKTIVEHNYVLVRGADKKISGIVTAADIALQFEQISTPFLLLSEIENSIRVLLSSKLNADDIRRSCSKEFLPSKFEKIADLTFGNYVKVLENENNWKKVGLNLDRKTFCQELAEINEIRNDVMHFNPDPLPPQSLPKLRNVAKMFELLRSGEPVLN